MPVHIFIVSFSSSLVYIQDFGFLYLLFQLPSSSFHTNFGRSNWRSDMVTVLAVRGSGVGGTSTSDIASWHTTTSSEASEGLETLLFSFFIAPTLVPVVIGISISTSKAILFWSVHGVSDEYSVTHFSDQFVHDVYPVEVQTKITFIDPLIFCGVYQIRCPLNKNDKKTLFLRVERR